MAVENDRQKNPNQHSVFKALTLFILGIAKFICYSIDLEKTRKWDTAPSNANVEHRQIHSLPLLQ